MITEEELAAVRTRLSEASENWLEDFEYGGDIIPGFSNPDATFIAHAREDVERLLEKVDFLERFRDSLFEQKSIEFHRAVAAEDRISAALLLHEPTDYFGTTICSTCSGEELEHWPCDTARALGVEE